MKQPLSKIPVFYLGRNQKLFQESVFQELFENINYAFPAKEEWEQESQGLCVAIVDEDMAVETENLSYQIHPSCLTHKLFNEELRYSPEGHDTSSSLSNKTGEVNLSSSHCIDSSSQALSMELQRKDGLVMTFLQMKVPNLKVIQEFLMHIPLAGIIHNKMSREDIFNLMDRKVFSQTTTELSLPGHFSEEVFSQKNPPLCLEPLLESLREMVLPSLQEISSICRHWVQKCEAGYKGSPHFSSDIKDAKKAAKRCQELIQSFNEFVKGQNPMEKLSLKQVVRTTLSFIEKDLKDDLDWHLELAAPNDTLWGSKELLEQALFNIIFNACQASSKGGSLYIRVYQSDESNGPSLCFEVEDKGYGIPADQLQRIFEPFFTTKTQGTGLGLYLCRQVFEQCRGRVNVQSQMGQGTMFQVLWPLQGTNEDAK